MRRIHKLFLKPVSYTHLGMGAMIGLELVKDAESKEPAAELTSKVIQSAAQKGLIIENAGIYGNVLRFLAPLVITDEQLRCV